MGNKADISDTDIMLALAEDEHTKVILGYIEGVGDGRKFMDVATQVSKKKPVIILKSGITSSGAKAASSHTGALAGAKQPLMLHSSRAGLSGRILLMNFSITPLLLQISPFRKARMLRS